MQNAKRLESHPVIAIVLSALTGFLGKRGKGEQIYFSG